MKNYFLFIVFFILFTSKSFSEDYKFTKITNLNEPWGSSFINNDQIIITEKGGKIKIINITSKAISEVDHNINFLNIGQGGLLDILYKDIFL